MTQAPAAPSPPSTQAPSSADHPIVRQEMTLLAQVRAALQVPSTQAVPDEAPIVAELLRLRTEMGTARGDDHAALLEQYHAQVSLLDQLRAARVRDEVDPDSPYFAHLRLREEVDGRERIRDLCIGKATRIEGGVRIVDWRNAPVSQLFYRYRQGDTYQEEMGGKDVEGEVEIRRTVSIRAGELMAIYAPDGTFQRLHGQGWRQVAAQAPRMSGSGSLALQWRNPETSGRRLGVDAAGQSTRKDKHLPDIAGLIDPEQFDLITRPEGFVVIRGGAGSGKTTVALHRIAWLAHNDSRVDSDRTMVLVVSRGLRDYVSHVLPALGVSNVQIHTYAAWARALRHEHFPKLPRGQRDDTPATVVAFKNHPAAVQALQWQIERSRGPATATQVTDDWANALTNPRLLAEAVAATVPGAFDEDELERVAYWCASQHRALLAWRNGGPTASARSDDEGSDAVSDLQDDDDGLFAQPPLDEEDDSLLLYAWQRRVGPLQGRNHRPLRLLHVAIDEVQDFSPVDVRVVLGCLDAKRSLTLAGDTQQHVMKDAGFTSWGAFLGHLGVDGTAVDTLRISYRCTQEVVAFASEVLGPLREDDPPLVTRQGPPVELFPFTDHGACVAFLADALTALAEQEPDASIAVLTPTRQLSELYAHGLERGDVPRVHLVTQQNFTFAPGVEVAEVSEVKGLEFDYVVLVEVSATHYPDTDAARRVLHVGATRAIHQLWLTTVEPTSPLLPQTMSADG